MSVYLRMQDGQQHSVGEAFTPIECFRCGICCTRYQPPLPPEEVEAIARELGLSSSDFLSEYVQITVVGYLLRHTETGCIFLKWEDNNTAGCSIHPFRPEACRNWIASLSQCECQEGLRKLKTQGKILLAPDIYTSLQATEQ